MKNKKSQTFIFIVKNYSTRSTVTYLGLVDCKGRLCAGYDADIVISNEDYSIYETYVGGISLYSKEI